MGLGWPTDRSRRDQGRRHGATRAGKLERFMHRFRSSFRQMKSFERIAGAGSSTL